MPKKISPVPVKFSPEVMGAIERYIEDMLQYLITAHRDLHENKIPRWRKLYLGMPAEATRNFPFPNAANSIVQVIGETVDTMTARVMGLLFATHPLWVFKNYVKVEGTEDKKRQEEKRRILEDFMDTMGIEPDELNLQFVEALWFTDAAKLGTSFVKVGIEEQVESMVVGYEETKIKGEEIRKVTPKVVKLRHEDVLADPKVHTLEDSDFVAIRHTLTRHKLEGRGFSGSYDKKAVEDVLKSPDRSGPSTQQQQELQSSGIQPVQQPDVTAEWDVFECFFPFWHNGRQYRLTYSYHKKTKKVLRAVFNFLPGNSLPVKRAKLGYRTDGLYGHGYAELLETYQEELSTTHNQRLDNATVANIRALRVSPRARALDANIELYPSALLVGEKDDIEAIQVGDVYPSTFKNEEMTLGLVARRAGITPAISGAGTGGVMKKPNVYSSQGTLAVMQENNSVVGFATSEFRHAHVTLGSLVTALFGKFGTDGREEMFGLDGALLKEALQEFSDNRMRIPIRSSTGALNKEVDKQAGMLMSGLMQRHYQSVTQMLQAMMNPIVPPQVKKYMMEVVVAAEQLHRKIIKDFGYEQPDQYVPEAQVGESQEANAGGPMAPGGQPMGGGGAPAGGGIGAGVPIGGMEGSAASLAPNTGGGGR